MNNLRKLRVLPPAGDTTLRDGIAEHAPDENVAAIVLKDCHLVEAALATDRRVAALDDKVRNHLAGLLAAVPPLQSLLWVNPASEEEKVVEWLEAGAPDQKKRRLKRKQASRGR
jgi:hypothetical protein